MRASSLRDVGEIVVAGTEESTFKIIVLTGIKGENCYNMSDQLIKQVKYRKCHHQVRCLDAHGCLQDLGN